MRRLFPLLALFLVSCSAYPLYVNTKYYPPIDISPEYPWEWVTANITYTDDYRGSSTSSPERTYWTRQGDCEDFCLLLMYFLHNQGIETEVLFVELKCVPGSCHAIVRLPDGYLIEAQQTAYYYPYDSILRVYRRYSYHDFLLTSS